MGRDDREIRTPADILWRASRPQRHSTHVPRKRDWRYATGIFKYEDFDDCPGEMTIWDKLDADYYGPSSKRQKRKPAANKNGDESKIDDDEEIAGIGRERVEQVPLTLTTASQREKANPSSTIPQKVMPKTAFWANRVETTTTTQGSKQTRLTARLRHLPKKMSVQLSNTLPRPPTPRSMVSQTPSLKKVKEEMQDDVALPVDNPVSVQQVEPALEDSSSASPSQEEEVEEDQVNNNVVRPDSRSSPVVDLTRAQRARSYSAARRFIWSL